MKIWDKKFKIEFLYLFLFFISFYIIQTSPISANISKENRWFDIYPGGNIFVHGADIDGKNYNKMKLRFDYGFSIDFDFPVDPLFKLNIEMAYLQQGAYNVVPLKKSYIYFNYISLTHLYKLEFYPGFLFLLGFSHQFLLAAQGQFLDPVLNLSVRNLKRINRYNAGLVLGAEVVIKNWEQEKVALIGAFKVEIGLVNLLKFYEAYHHTTRFPILSLGLRFY